MNGFTEHVWAARQIFREDLLRGHSIALSGAVAEPVRELLRVLGARLTELDPELATDEEALTAWARAASPLDVLIRGEGVEHAIARDWLLACTWATVRAIATETFIPARRGRIVLLALRPGEPQHAEPACAALENLARTLSVEWARFGITTVVVVPRAASSDDQLAQLVAFLCSPAGAYFSGCRFDLGLVERGNRRR